jgi:hypothetical protein
MRKGEFRRESKGQNKKRDTQRVKHHTSFDLETPGTFSAPAPPQSAAF